MLAHAWAVVALVGLVALAVPTLAVAANLTERVPLSLDRSDRPTMTAEWDELDGLIRLAATSNVATDVTGQSFLGSLVDPAPAAGDNCARSGAIAVADVSGDGRPDIVVGCPGDNGSRGNVLVFTKNSGVGYAHDSTLVDPSAAANDRCGSSVATGDIDSDSRVDVVVGCRGDNSSRGNVLVFTKNSGAGFTYDSALTDPAAAVNDACGAALVVVDFNADTRPDVVAGCSGDNSFRGNVLTFTKNSGAGFTHHATLTDSAAASLDQCGSALATGDANADGRPDLVVGCSGDNSNRGNAILFTKNSGAGFAQESTATDPAAAANDLCGYSVGLGDIDADGRADLIMGCPGDTTAGANTGNVVVFTKNSGAGYTHHASFTGAPSSGSLQCGMSSGLIDMNADGRADALVGCGYGNSSGVAIYTKNSGAGFTYVANARDDTFAAIGCGTSLATADLDGDGTRDLAVGCQYGTGAGKAFAVGMPLTPHLLTDTTPAANEYCGYGVSINDVNGDGRDDALVHCMYLNHPSPPLGGTLVYTKNAGPGFTYDSTVTPTLPTYCLLATSVDLNADGRADIVQTCTGGTIQIHLRTVGGSFTSSSFTAPANCYATPAGADVNEDDRMDLVLGCPDGGTGGYVLVYTQNRAGTWTLANTLIDPAPVFGDECGASIAVGDINDDRRPDLLVGCAGDASDAGNALVFTKNAGPGFTHDTTLVDPAPATGDDCGVAVAFGDVNADGRSDAVIGCRGNASDEGNVLVFTKNAGSGFTHDNTLVDTNPSSSVRGACGTSVSTGDINADGSADILVGCMMRNATGGALLFRRNGSGFVMDKPVTPPYAAASGCGTSVALGDVDNDGRADHLVGCPQASVQGAVAGSTLYGSSVASVTYPASRTVQTRRLNGYGGIVLSATITIDSVLNSGSISALQASADGGTNWESITNGALHTFTATGNDLRVRATMASNPGNTQTPLVHRMALNYTTVNNAPATSLVSPADATSTSDVTPDLTATYTDVDTVDVGTLEFEVCSVAMGAGQSCTAAGGSVLASGSVTGRDPGTNGTWTASTLPAPQTMHWHARSVDDAGGTGAWTVSRSITTTVTNTLTGTVTDTSMCDGFTPVVGIAVNSTKWSTRPCAPGTGAWNAWPSWNLGDTVTVYYDDVPIKGSNHIRMPFASSTPLTGVVVYAGAVITQADNVTPASELDFDRWGGDDDPDVMARYPVSSRLEVDPSMLFVVLAGRFAPSVTVQASRVRVTNGGTYIAGSTRLNVLGSGTQNCSSVYNDAPFCVMSGGVFSPGTGTVSFQPSSNSVVLGRAYHNLEIVSAANNTIELGAPGATSFTIGGDLAIHGTGGAPVVSTTGFAPSVTAAGSLTVDGSATLAGSGSGQFMIGRDVGGTGDVDLSGGIFYMTASAATTVTLNPSGTLPGTAWRFASLYFYKTIAGDRSVVIPTTARAIEARTGFVTNVGSPGTLTVDATNTTQPITAYQYQDGPNTEFRAPPRLNIGAMFFSSGTFVPNAGTVAISGASSTATVGIINTGSFHHLNASAPGTAVELATNITITHSLTITGSSCSNPVALRSDTPGAQRTVANGGATSTIQYATFQDTAFTNPATASDSRSLGNNANISYTGSPCISTVIGTAQDATACDGATPVIGIAVNSAKWGEVPCTAGTGAFTAEPTFAAGDIVTVYYDDVAQRGSSSTRTIDASTAGAIAVVLLDDFVIVSSLDPSTPITSLDIGRWDHDDDPDIGARYPVSAGLDVQAGRFAVLDGTFDPGTDVDVERIWIAPSGTYLAGSHDLTIRGAGTDGCSDPFGTAPACGMASGFAAGTGTVRYVPTATSVVSGGTYHALEVVGSTTSTIVLGSGDDPAITASTVVIDGTAGAPTIRLDGSMVIAGTLDVNGTATLTSPTMTSFQVGGSLTGTGNIDLTGGTLSIVAVDDLQIDAAGPHPGTPWKMGMLQVVNGDSVPHTVTIPATSRALEFDYLITDGGASDLAVDASAVVHPLRASALIVGPTVTFDAPSNLVLDIGMSAAGTFVPGTGEVSFTGTGPGILIGSPTSSFYDVDVSAPGKSLAVQGPLTVTNSLTVTSTSCQFPSSISSYDPGVQQTINVAGATLNVTRTIVQDIDFAPPVLAHGAVDGGNNADVTFDGRACAPVSGFFGDDVDASSGAATPTSIDGTGAFHHSFLNNTEVDADRYKAEVTTTVLNDLVRGLWALDGSGTDRSDNANALTASGGGPSWVTGGANFGQAADFDGIDDTLSAPSSSEYDVNEFTVDLWMRAPALSTSPAATLVSRALSANNGQFAIWTDAAQGQLHAAVTAGGTQYDVSVPAAPWLDDTWHHVAMTVDAAKNIRLYVDGLQRGSTQTYSGTLDLPAAPLRIGGAGGAGTYFDGMIDDVHFYSVAVPADGIAGYARTKRPHAQTIWRSANALTPTGDALASTCTAWSRCSDVIYDGPDIHVEGARYYFRAQVGTTNGFWSYEAEDWFETGDAITVSAPGTVPLPSLLPTTDVTTNFAVTSDCSGHLGCDVLLSGASNTAALANTSDRHSIPPIAPAAPAAPGTWTAGASLGVGVTVLASSSGKDTARWGVGSDFSDMAALRFVGPTRAGTLLQHRAGSGVETTDVGIRVNVPLGTEAGSYIGHLEVVAVPSV